MKWKVSVEGMECMAGLIGVNEGDEVANVIEEDEA